MTIDAPLVRDLVSTQFPEWAGLSVSPVEHDGHDNRTFRLGSDKLVRLPSHGRYEPQVDKEHLWLPRLAPLLPLPIPTPVAMGAPGSGYPFKWSVYKWIEGEIATTARIDDIKVLATELAEFMVALQAIDPSMGPSPGPHNFYRGGSLAVYEEETLNVIDELDEAIDRVAALSVWEAARSAPDHPRTTWLHGDLAASNLLVEGGRLKAVIDFGICGVGDPSCDLKIAWTFFDRATRRTFRERLGLDGATWARGRGWALWKNAKWLAEEIRRGGTDIGAARRCVDEILRDHRITA